MAELRFDGRVALVTGAGGGLGKEYALMLASRGASVVVNDLGVDRQGKGQGSKMADKVVDEIRAKGGKAVANYDSVEFGEKVIQTALDNFGRIDIIINNAGILRDRSFARISDTDWDLIQNVHLRGSFLITRAAWPHMKKQGYGRIIMTSSASGLYGNFGQANYSAAKMGLVGLSNTLAIEGTKYNITCNTIAPMAASRLTEDIMPEEVFNLMKPEYVAPVVLYLCHEDCTETHGIFEVGAGWAGKIQVQRGKGVICLTEGQRFTPESVRDNWSSVCDMTDSFYPKAAGESTFLTVQAHEEAKDKSESTRTTSSSTSATDEGFNPSIAIGQKFTGAQVSITANDVILYALGVGASTRQPDHLKFLFELSEDFSTLPTYGVLLGQKGMMNVFTGTVPGLRDIDITKILHGEQYMEIHKPIPTSGTMTSVSEVADIMDKGSGALIITETKVYDESNELVCVSQGGIFLVGAGGFGGKKTSERAKLTVKPPSRTPDASVKETTTKDQAALYRLSGDTNPLHIDPGFASMGGFEQPILHGLCTFGFSCRHVLKQYADNDVTKFKAVKCRFAKPVLPGQTIQTDMWREGNRIHFQTKVAETGTVVISGAYVDLINLDPQPSTEAPPSITLQSDVIFEEMSRQLPNNLEVVKKARGVIAYNITKDGKLASQWTLDLKTGHGAIYSGPPRNDKADVTVTTSDEDLLAITSGKLNPQQAFMSGRLKAKGNIMLLQKISQLLETKSKL